MNTIVPTSTLPRRGLRSPQPAVHADITHISRTYGIGSMVSLDARVLREYEPYSSDPLMTVEECVVSLLAFNLQTDPDASRLSVILARTADRRPVEVVLDLCRHRKNGSDHLCLVFADEAEI